MGSTNRLKPKDETTIAGRQPPELTAHRLIRTVDLPIAWAAQKQLLGIP